MAGRLTMADVAAAAGVSAKTVSNVLAASGGYSPQTEARVLAVVENLGYRLNTGARTLRSRRSGTIALALPTLRQPTYAALAQAVIEAAGDVPVLLELTRGEARLEEDVLRGRLAREADGVLWVPQALDVTHLALQELAPRTQRPVVVVGGRPTSGTDQVTSPVAQQVALALDHLADEGRRRPAVIGVVDDADDWTSTCALTLAQRGTPVSDGRIVRVTDAVTLRSGVEAVLRLLRTGTRFDALLCHNDALAAGALGTLLRHGAQVPRDVAVIGRGDTEVAVYASPALTSVSPGLRTMARSSVTLLGQRIGPGAPRSGPRSVSVEPMLTVRASTH